MKLSVCIITKNEKENLRKCLECLKLYDVEIVVADTGSTDGTMEMVREYTEALYEFPWCDDFAKAKNYVTSKATNDWILLLDSDEYVQKMDIAKILEYMSANPEVLGGIQRKNYIYQSGEIHSGIETIYRLFHRDYYEFRGRIHEQLVRKDGKTGRRCGFPVEIDHSGYLLSDEEKKKKAARNIELLEKELQSRPEDTYILYQLGKSHYMSGNYQKSCEYFGKALSHELDTKLEYVIDMVETYGYALIYAGRASEALGYEGLQEEFGSTSDFWFLMGYIYMNNELFEDAIASFEKAVLVQNAKMTGTDGYLAYYNAGVICECLNDWERATAYYWKSGVYQQAVKRLGAYFEGRNPIQAYLYYQQMEYICENTKETDLKQGLQEIKKWKEGIYKKCKLQLPKTAIVILSYNTLEETKACIESIRNNCNPDTYELVVVDNASEDSSPKWLKMQHDIKLQCNTENAGFPKGCNQGITLAKKDSDIWLLNSDTLVPPNALFWLQMGLYESERTGAAGSVSNYCPNYQNIKEENVTDKNYLEYANKHEISISNPYEKKTWLVGFSLLLKRKALDEIGLLDECFSPGNFEDTDIGYRLAEKEWQQLLCYNSFVFHYGSRSFGKKRERFHRLLETNERKFIEKWNVHPSKYSYRKTWEIEQISVEKKQEIRVLDVGCGMGATISAVQHKYPAAQVIGIERMLEAAKFAGEISDVYLGDVCELEIEEFANQFDYILTGTVCSNVGEPSEILLKLKQWVRKGGYITGSVYNKEHSSVKNGRYTAEEWITVLSQNGIKVDEFSFTKESISDQKPYQYFWKGHLA